MNLKEDMKDFKKNNLQLYIIIIILLLNCQNTTNKKSGSSGGGNGSAQRSDSAYEVNINLSGSFQNPAWSPDGNSLLFTRFRNGYNEGPADLYIIDLTTLTLTLLVGDGSENVNLPGSAWNSNINKVVFSSSRGDANPDYDHDEIYSIIDSGSPGDEVKQTERNGLQAYEPSFSPNGDFIVFESHVVDVEVDGKIFKKDLSQAITTGFTELTSSGDCRQPNWAPAGDHILFQKVVSNKWDIWIMETNGNNPTKVTTSDGDNTDASFSPDGKNIVYSADGELEYANIYVIPITGGTPKRLTFFDGGYDGAPSWSPNGEKLAFESCQGDPDDSSGTTIWIIDIPDGF